jgi:hypothetical protein
MRSPGPGLADTVSDANTIWIGPLVRQAVARLKDQHLEHQHMIKSRLPPFEPSERVTARSRSARDGSKSITAVSHSRASPFGESPLRLLNVEKASLTPHPPPPSRTPVDRITNQPTLPGSWRSQLALRHTARIRALNASMNALSVGVPGLGYWKTFSGAGHGDSSSILQ